MKSVRLAKSIFAAFVVRLLPLEKHCSDSQEHEWNPDYVQDFMVSTLKDDGVFIDEKSVSYNEIVQIYTEVYHGKQK